MSTSYNITNNAMTANKTLHSTYLVQKNVLKEMLHDSRLQIHRQQAENKSYMTDCLIFMLKNSVKCKIILV